MSSRPHPNRAHDEVADTKEEVVSPALRRRLQECFEHARKLMQLESYDFDYAHTMLVECVSRDPGNLVYLDAFFANLYRKYNNNKRGSMLRFARKGGIKRAVARQDWSKVLKQGPHVLKTNPWDVPTLRAMAEACAAGGMYEAELRYLKNALEARPADPEVNRHCAQSLGRRGRFDQAIVCWQRVDEARGGDAEAQEMIAELQIGRTQLGFGKPPTSRHGKRKAAASPRTTGSATESPTEAQPPPNDEAPRRAIQLTPRQQLEQALVMDPADLDNYLALADLHVQQQRLGEAAHVLTKALAVSGNDLQVQQRLEEVEMARMHQHVAVAQQRFTKEGSEESRQLVEELRNDLNRYELEVYDRRSQRFPQDLELKFQLGVRLMRVGNFRQAIHCLEQASSLESRQALAAFELGECHQRLKRYAKALECYRRAAELADQPDQRQVQCRAWYRGAVLAAGLDDVSAAEALLVQLIHVDPHYRDAAARLDKIRQMRHKG